MIQSRIAWEDREANLLHFGELLAQVSGSTSLAVLPETFTTGFSMNAGQLAEAMDESTIQAVTAWAREYQMAITGSFIAREGERCFNRAFFVTPEGDTHYYDKRHLFRMSGEDQHFSAGTRQLVVTYKGWKICLLVCYDLRFPVWSRNVDNAYDLLICVANWPEVRREVWRTLLQARAMENMAYVCGVNRVGADGMGVAYCGDSMICEPKGRLLSRCEKNRETTHTCTLFKAEVNSLRNKFPAWKDADRFTLNP
jgi:predicted amidohydrolase